MIVRLKRVGYPEQLFESAGKLELEFGKNVGQISFTDNLGPREFEFELSQLNTWEDISWYTDPLEKFKQPLPARTESQVSTSASSDIQSSPSVSSPSANKS